MFSFLRRRSLAVERAAVVTMAIGAVWLSLFTTGPHGPAVTTDSVFYLSTAENLAGGRGLWTFKQQPPREFPPGFPGAVAALSSVSRAPPLDAARAVNALALGLTVLFAWLLLTRHVGSSLLRLMGVAAIAISPRLAWASTFAWSEAMFVACMLGAVICLELAVERAGDWRWVAIAAVPASAAALTRYVGLTILIAGAIVLLAANRSRMDLSERARRAALFTGIAGAAPALWIARNLHYAAGEPFGKDDPPEFHADHVLKVAAAVGDWLVPVEATTAVMIAVAAVAVGGLRTIARRPPVTVERETSQPARSLLPLTAVALAYVGFLTAALVTITPVWKDSYPRYLVPAFAPALVLAVVLFDRFVRPRLSGPRVAIAIILPVAWLAAAGLQTADWVAQLRRQGYEFTGPRFRSSAVAAAVRSARMRPTWSNRTDLLWFTTSVTARCWPTLDDDFLCRGGVRDYNAFAEALATGPKYLAWFREPGRRRPYRPAALPAELQLTELGSWPDGGLYRVELRRESASLARG